MDDTEFLILAIEKSRESVSQGCFPAGAVVAKDGVILTSEISDRYPGYQHAECKAIDTAFQKQGVLTGAVLYASLEPCLMCLSRAYWAGIRKVLYAISRERLNPNYWEGRHIMKNIIDSLNDSMEYRQVIEHERDALEVVRKWEGKFF